MLPPPRELPERAPRLADGRYVLLARVGRGGMAGVYAAWDTQIDEWRAIKVLLPKHARDRSIRNRFENEARTMISLTHPNLLRVYEVGAGEKLPFIVMDLVSAGSLYRWTKTFGPMPSRMAVEAMIQLCAGVTAVHAAGVVHRDIKPRNVLINWDGVLKLTDFGIAQLENSHETRTGLAMGTLGFMSPEQLHDAKSVDERTDIYAIGATLWTLITARKARDLFRLEDKPSLMDGVSDLVRPVLAKTLAYERDDRHASSEELAHALEGLLPKLPEDPPDAPPLPLNLGSPSLKSKPENTFSEILTLNGDEEPEKVSGPTPQAPPASAGPAPAKPVRAPRTVGPPSSVSAAERLRPHAPGTIEDEESLPSYLIGVEQADDIRRAELISAQLAALERAAPQRRSRWRTLLIGLLLTPVALVLGGVLMIAAIGAFGASQLKGAASEAAVARERFSDQLRYAEPLADEIEALGTDGAQLRASYAAWSHATEESRVAAGLTFVALADELSRPLLRSGTRPHEEQVVRQRLGDLQAAQGSVLETTDAWNGVAGSAQAKLAITLRLADGPPGLDGL